MNICESLENILGMHWIHFIIAIVFEINNDLI